MRIARETIQDGFAIKKLIGTKRQLVLEIVETEFKYQMKQSVMMAITSKGMDALLIVYPLRLDLHAQKVLQYIQE